MTDICTDCGSRIIEGDRGFYVCENCGLCTTRVYETYNNPYKNNKESDYRKQHRESKIMKKQIKNKLQVESFQQIQIWKEVYELYKIYCNKHKLVMRDTTSKIITDFMFKELKLSDD